MRLLIVSEVFWPEDFIINDLAQEWIKMGYEVEVITQYPSYPYSQVFEGYKNKGYTTEFWNGIKIHRYPFVEGYKNNTIKKLINYHKFVHGGKRVVDSLKGAFDCIFVSQTGPLTVTYPALYAKRKLRVPVNIWICDIWPDAVWAYGVPKNFITNIILGKLIRNIYKNCDKLFISSKKFEETIRVYSEKECIYTPNWLRPVDNVKSSLKLPKNKINFTFTGNISRYQNLINTINGFIKANIDNSQLNIVGDGSYLDEVKDAAKQINAKNVIFHGRKPYNEMHDILSQSQILVLPLISKDGIEKTEPFKIQSYLQAGKPIFGIINGAGRDIIEENKIGLCADPTNVEAIAEGFRLMVTFSKGHRITPMTKKLMETRFNKQKIVKKITDNLVIND